MTNSFIEQIINKLNGVIGDNTIKIYKYQISKSVDYAKVWYEFQPKCIKYSNLFLIRNSSKYVGAVDFLRDDLHWFVLEKERKKGHLSKALQTAILPFLFKKIKLEKISLTIVTDVKPHADSSARIAKAMGFKYVDSRSFVLYKDQFDYSKTNISIQYEGITATEIDTLKNEIGSISLKLEQLQTQFEFATGFVMEKYQKPTLQEISTTIKSRIWSIDDIYHDFLMSDNNK